MLAVTEHALYSGEQLLFKTIGGVSGSHFHSTQSCVLGLYGSMATLIMNHLHHCIPVSTTIVQ